MKEAKVSDNSIAWHQDFGYWYQVGCLRPEMGSVLITIDR